MSQRFYVLKVLACTYTSPSILFSLMVVPARSQVTKSCITFLQPRAPLNLNFFHARKGYLQKCHLYAGNNICLCPECFRSRKSQYEISSSCRIKCLQISASHFLQENFIFFLEVQFSIKQIQVNGFYFTLYIHMSWKTEKTINLILGSMNATLASTCNRLIINQVRLRIYIFETQNFRNFIKCTQHLLANIRRNAIKFNKHSYL